MSIIYRPAQKDDLDAGAGVVQRAMNELRPRHGLAVMPSPPPTQFPAFCLDRDPEGLWVAEADGSIIGWSFSWRHQTFSFLSQLDVVPEAQGKGVGQALLNHAARWARQQGVVDRALITFAFNSHSIGLYIRNGFHARVPLYLMSAPASIVARKIETEGVEAFEVGPHNDASVAREWMGGIDEEVLSFRRDAYHEFLALTDPTEAMAITRDGEPVGYCYISKSGHRPAGNRVGGERTLCGRGGGSPGPRQRPRKPVDDCSWPFRCADERRQ